jgi:uncharacterized protein (DUF1697 family)
MAGQRNARAVTYAALLRGVNVGGKNKLPMADLRQLFEKLGFADVRSYIQSGNVVFSSERVPDSAALQTAIHTEFGITTSVIMRSSTELASVPRHNAFPDVEEASLHVGFMALPPTVASLEGLDVDRFGSERFAVVGRDLYLYLPVGMGQSKLPGYLDRRLKVPLTVRNWNTVTKLIELAGG